MEKKNIVLCDTDVIIEFYRNNPDIVSELKKIGQANIAISTITAGELIFGAFNKKELKQITKDIENLTLICIGERVCDIFIDVMTRYSLSHRLTLADGFIAATAMANQIELFTLNHKDFKYINNLNLYNQTE